MVVYAGLKLPLSPTPFIGRESEIKELVILLQNPDCRLLTLVGPGGVGKTRLAIELARQQVDMFHHGIHFVPLTPLNSPAEIVPTIINVLGLHIAGEDTPHEELVNVLKQRHLLLLMDNFEHLLGGVDLITDILQVAPDVKIITTSREVLNLREEWVWHVRGMRFPDGLDSHNGRQYDALQLFSAHADRMQRDFNPQAELTHIVRICQLVEGMPLALELAASWLKTLTCAEIAEEIQRSIDFLATKMRNAPERHRSMRAVFDHSWDLCSPDEQAAFRRLCVFRGGFEREAAEQVADATLLTLSGLVEKSMLRKLPSGRYDMQELLRQYAEEHLKASGEIAATQDAHMRYYAGFMDLRTPDIKGRRQLAAFEEIETDFDNVRAAWTHAVENRDDSVIDRMMEGVALYCDMRSQYQAGKLLFQHAVDEFTLANMQPPVFRRLCAYWVHVQTLTLKTLSDESTRQRLTHYLMLAQQGDSTDITGLCLWLHGEIHRLDGDKNKALELCELAQEQLDDPYYIGRVLRIMVYCLIGMGSNAIQETQNVNDRHLELVQRVADESGLIHALFYQAYYVDDRTGFLVLKESAALSRKTGDFKSLGIMLFFVARMTCLQGEFEEARHMALEAIQLLEDCGWSNMSFPYTTLGLIHVFQENDTVGHQILAEYMLQHEPPRFHTNIVVHALVLIIYGLLEQSRDFILNALYFASEQLTPIPMAGCIPMCAIQVAQDGDAERAAQLLGLAFTYSDHFLMGWMQQWPRLTRMREQLQAQLGKEAYQAAWERGQKHDLRRTISELLTYFDNEAAETAQPLIDPLSERELEVLALVSTGLSNREIAEKLTVVVGTVKSHIHNICQKLDAANRTQAVAIARELNLLL